MATLTWIAPRAVIGPLLGFGRLTVDRMDNAVTALAAVVGPAIRHAEAARMRHKKQDRKGSR